MSEVKKYLIVKAAEPEDLGQAYAESLPTLSGYEENLTPTLPTIVKAREMDESQVEEVLSRPHVISVEEDVEDEALFETPGVAFEGPSEGIETVDALEYHEILAARKESPASNVTIAVLDTGLKGDEASGLLKNNVVDQRSFIDNETVEDPNGHGCVTPESHVATTLCGVESIETAYHEAATLYGSEESVVEGQTGRSVVLPVEHHVAGFADGASKQVRLQAVHQIPYEGTLIKIVCGAHEFRLTPWHKVLVKGYKCNGLKKRWRYKRADELQPGEHLTLPTSAPLRSEILEDEDADHLYLLGLVVGDGHLPRKYVRQSGDQKGHPTSVYTFITRGGFVTPLLDKLGYRYFIRPSGDVQVSGRDLYEYCVLNGVPIGRKSRIVGLPRIACFGDNLWPWLAGYVDADGCWDKDRVRLRMRTASEKLARQLVVALGSHGIKATCIYESDDRTRELNGHTFDSTWGTWSISVSGNYAQEVARKIAPYALNKKPQWEEESKRRPDYLSISAIEREEYSGYLYDFSTESGNYLAGGTAAAIVSNTFCSVAATRGGAKLLVCKVLRNSGSGPRSSILAGIDWAVQEGANVISMSLGSASTSEAYDAAISGARSRGVIVFAAAGNGGRQNQPVNAPGNCKDAICVAAIDHRNERIADFSCKGPEVDVAAAGVDISYRGKSFSGTSMATPLSVAAFSTVRGAVEDPALALKAFFSGCKDTPAPVEAEGLGVPKALKAIQSTKPAPPVVLPEKDKPEPYYADLPRIPAYATAKWIGTKAVLTRGGHEAGYYEPKPVVSRELAAVIDSEYCECEGGCC